MIISIISAIFIISGLFFFAGAAIGILRFPDFYTRTHAASLTDGIGAGLVLWGLILVSGFTLTSVKLLMVAVLILVTSPTASHALVKAAYAAGVGWKRGDEP